MKRTRFDVLNYRGTTSVFILPTVGFKAVDSFKGKNICLCFAWLCFGLSIWFWTLKRSDTE